jgi:hypothetical protein
LFLENYWTAGFEALPSLLSLQPLCAFTTINFE